MGSWDCYCALCAGPLGKSWISIGSKRRHALRARRKRLHVEMKKLKKIQAGESASDDEVNSDVDMDDDENLDRQMEVLARTNWHNSNEKENHNEDDEEGNDDDDDENYEESSESASSFSSENSIVNSDDGSESDLYTGNIPDVEVPAQSESEHENDHDDSWSQCSELSIYSHHTFFHGTSETQKEDFDSSETSSYDPSVLNPSIIQWMDRCRAIGYNDDARSIKKAYITGRGRYDDYGSFNVKRPGNDPNDNGSDHITCYYTFGSGESPVFPFHEACFRILAKSLGYPDYKMVDKDLLYKVLSQNIEGYSSSLNVDYGLVPRECCEQFWSSSAGEEIVVCDPGPQPELDKTLQSVLPAKLFNNSLVLANLSSKVRNDPWTVLPYDLLLDIFSYLSIEDILSLLTASWHVSVSTRDNAFWNHMLRTRFSSWFWELPSFLNTSTFPATFDFKRLFIWLNSATAPVFGARGPLIGIANRRRIWEVCQHITPSYLEQVPLENRLEPNDDEAKELLEGAVCLHMPVVLHPQPEQTLTISAQFIRSWSEISDRSCAISVYWSIDNKMTGLCVTFGNIKRVFGSIDGHDQGQSMYIPANDWISTIIVYFDDDLAVREQPHDSQGGSHPQVTSEVAIVRLEIISASGRTKSFETSSRGSLCSHRPFIVLPDMALIGLTGEISATGVISRLGLLQAARPGTSSQLNNTLPAYTLAQTLLYSLSAKTLQTETYPHNGKIWSHPTYTVHGWPNPKHEIDATSDLLLHEILLWAEIPKGYEDVTGLSAMQVTSGVSCNVSSTSSATYPILEIRSLKKRANTWMQNGATWSVPYNHPSWYLNREPSSDKFTNASSFYKDATTSHFDIDGAGGEVVTEVHFSPGSSTLKLRTNRERECVWGDAGQECENVKRAEPGEQIIGLSCCFRKHGGPRGRLIDVAVVTRKMESEADEEADRAWGRGGSGAETEGFYGIANKTGSGKGEDVVKDAN